MAVNNDILADLIFSRWKASMVTRKKHAAAMKVNFDDLFRELFSCGISLEAGLNFLEKAIVISQPPLKVVQATYKAKPNRMPFDEYHASWKEFVVSLATTTFYEYFELPVELVEKPAAKQQEEIPIQKKYGSMTEEEYREYRAYADSFETIDWTQIKKVTFDFDDIEL